MSLSKAEGPPIGSETEAPCGEQPYPLEPAEGSERRAENQSEPGNPTQAEDEQQGRLEQVGQIAPPPYQKRGCWVYLSVTAFGSIAATSSSTVQT